MKVRLDQFKEKNVIRMKQGWFDICSVRPDIKISSKELRTRLKLNSMKEYLQNGRLQWLDYLERMEESAKSTKCRTSKTIGVFDSG